jgi:RNA polymerase sigma factor (sigma-70 family)
MNDLDFTGLYKRYFPVVQQYIRIHSGTAHPEAEDIAQDIFLILWRRRDTLIRMSPLENYLFVMVRNRLLNETKKRSNRGRIWKEIAEAPVLFANVPYQHIDPRKAERWLQAAVDRLPPEPRATFVLRERHGLKVHEVASLMGLSPTGASRHLQQAEILIRSFLTRQLL